MLEFMMKHLNKLMWVGFFIAFITAYLLRANGYL